MYAEMALPTAEQTPVFLQGSRQPGAVEASSGTKPVWQASADATTAASIVSVTLTLLPLSPPPVADPEDAAASNTTDLKDAIAL
eukprot:CAMPEP_0183425192 /NCGR_PEP_ID=MMETSP0370-20130417/33952_1 /TAXON_ID=268820 /ORGANISM="Peridinium aciculiferum, Strain PAER-2" /LENGTH=83 /DNA_ID=CAMNT_0025609469 /DNA_START=1 /DNA_END=249 /DNA_ORIENTATION=-